MRRWTAARCPRRASSAARTSAMSSRRSRRSAPGPQLLLNAHYDSTPTGPGAGDDGLGVAVLLEVGSILKPHRRARPVTLLFNEGEEFGLNGAHAFVRADPLARSGQFADQHRRARRHRPRADVRDQRSQRRGARASMRAQRTGPTPTRSAPTSPGSSRTPPTWSSSSRPAGRCSTTRSSATRTRYHSPGDTVAALDRDSLGHVGSEVLAATRAMASARRTRARPASRIVFTDIAGRSSSACRCRSPRSLLGLLLIAGFVLAWREAALGKPLLVAAAWSLGGGHRRRPWSASSRPAPRRRLLARLSARHLSRRLRRPAVVMAAVWWRRWGRAIDRVGCAPRHGS